MYTYSKYIVRILLGLKTTIVNAFDCAATKRHAMQCACIYSAL